MAKVYSNPQQLADVKNLLTQVGASADKAVRMAINRSANSTMSRVAKRVSEHITAPQRVIRNSISITRARSGDLRAAVTIRGKRIQLHEFDWAFYGQVYPNKTRRISVKVRKDQPRGQWRHAFLARLPQRGLGIYTRKGPKEYMKSGTHQGKYRQPIAGVFGPSVPNVFLVAPNIEKDVLEYAAERLAKELEYAANYLTKQQSGSLPNE
jgi:hypothetical protein